MAKQQTPTGSWYRQKVLQERPKITINVRPQKPFPPATVAGQIMGDQAGFALIRFDWHGLTIRFDAAWETVVDCLNGNRSLIY